MNTFGNCVKFEKEHQQDANNLYLNLPEVTTIKRYNCDTPWGKTEQLRDIDVSIKAGDRWINISEKFRSSHYGDMLIEIYSNWQKRKEGWGITGESDYIVYFTPNRTYFINAQQLKKLTQEIYDELNLKNCKEIYSYANKKINDKESCNIFFHKIPTISGNQIVYTGLCYSIDWEDLEKIGIEVTKYPPIY